MTNHETAVPARDRLFALIASIPGSGTVDWCSPARALLDEIAAVSVPPPAPQAADRRARYAAAIAEGFRAFDADTTSDAYLDAELLDAVVAVADAEEAELLAAVSVAPPAPRADDRGALRDRIRRAVCEAEGFMWNTELLEPDEYGEVADAVLAVLPEPADQAAALNRAADEVFALDYDAMVGEEGDENLGSMREAWDLGTIHAEKLLRRMADEAQQPDDGEGDELVCVDECGFCDACGFEPFGTPAEGWREAARFLRRTARDSGDRAGALHGARLIEAELRRLADESGPCVAGEQQNETPEAETPTTTKPETEAHPPHSRWYVETYDHLADEWAPGMRFGERAEAVARYETVCRNHPTRTDGSPARRRFVRETTTYTVEPAAGVRQDGAQPQGWYRTAGFDQHDDYRTEASE